MATVIQVKRGTASSWTSANTVLAAGEIGFETDTRKTKIGDGSTAWSSLSYATIDLSSLALTGTPTAPTASAGTNTTQLATTQFVRTEVSNLVASAPSTLDTLNELATALGNDASFSTTVTNSLAAKAPLASPSFTGTVSIGQILENATVSATAATGTVTYDVLTNKAVTYYTSNASGNWTLNIRGDGSNTLNSLMSTGQSLTIAFLVTNGGTAYYQTGFQIDGSAVTPKWQNGSAPSSGNINSIDIYTITVIKTADATFTAFASQTKFA
jgi:hypothetical protein